MRGSWSYLVWLENDRYWVIVVNNLQKSSKMCEIGEENCERKNIGYCTYI